MMLVEKFIRDSGNEGYVTPEQIKPLKDGTYVMAKRLMFHWTMIRGFQHDITGYFDRWCYETQELAMAALAEFPDDPSPTYEPTGWHRHPRTGRRRTDGDPSQEYIDA